MRLWLIFLLVTLIGSQILVGAFREDAEDNEFAEFEDFEDDDAAGPSVNTPSTSNDRPSDPLKTLDIKPINKELEDDEEEDTVVEVNSQTACCSVCDLQ